MLIHLEIFVLVQDEMTELVSDAKSLTDTRMQCIDSNHDLISVSRPIQDPAHFPFEGGISNCCPLELRQLQAAESLLELVAKLF